MFTFSIILSMLISAVWPRVLHIQLLVPIAQVFDFIKGFQLAKCPWGSQTVTCVETEKYCSYLTVDDINRTIASSSCFCPCVLLTLRKCGKGRLFWQELGRLYAEFGFVFCQKRSFHGIEENLLSFHANSSEDHEISTMDSLRTG